MIVIIGIRNTIIKIMNPVYVLFLDFPSTTDEVILPIVKPTIYEAANKNPVEVDSATG